MIPLHLSGPVADRPAELIVLIGFLALLPTALMHTHTLSAMFSMARTSCSSDLA